MSDYTNKLLSTIRFLQDTLKTDNINIEDHNITEPKREEKFLWLLIIDLLVFAGLSVNSYLSTRRMEKDGINVEDFRYKFMKSLIYANAGILK